MREENISSMWRSSPLELLQCQAAELSSREIEFGVVYLVKTEFPLSPVEPPAHVIHGPHPWVCNGHNNTSGGLINSSMSPLAT